MKKTIILIIASLILSGCSTTKKEEIDFCKNYIPNDIMHFHDEYRRNEDTIKQLTKYVSNTNNTNYSFTYDITNNTSTYHYEGQKFDDVKKYTYNNKTYQLENNIFYDINTKEEVLDIFNQIDQKPLSLYTYYSLSNLEYTCIITDNMAVCDSKENNTTITFTITDEYITKINYKTPNSSYILEYKDFNNIPIIPKIDYQTKTSYKKTNTIEKIEHDTYIIYNYYVTDTNVLINDNNVSITDTLEIFSNPMYYFEYGNIEEFIYNDDFTIIVIHQDNDKTIYYLTTYNHKNEILEQYK